MGGSWGCKECHIIFNVKRTYTLVGYLNYQFCLYMLATGKITQLQQEVVDKIAAGEVVVRPVNALKELVENSLDAGATEIRVELIQGGLELIRIQDNGHGIAQEDMPLVCSRFATSKLHAVEELRSIGTFGFRGEALASISIVADRVTITSKTQSDKCAHRAVYRGGKMESDCSLVAGLQGTIIVVDRLFQNAPARKSALRYPNEESNRIADLVVKYAIQYPSVSFVFRRINGAGGGGGSCGDFRTNGNGDQHGAVKTLLHAKMTKDLFNINLDDKTLHFRANFCLTSPLTLFTSTAIQAKQDRQRVFHLFINGRCVECVRMKQAIDAVFAAKDLYCPFVSVSLLIDPHRVDVNVHPTKSIVHFLEQDRIIERIEQELHQIASQYHKKGAIELNVFKRENSNTQRINNDVKISTSSLSCNQNIPTQQQSNVLLSRAHSFSVGQKGATTTPPSKTRIRVDPSNRTMEEFMLSTVSPLQCSTAVDSPQRLSAQCSSTSFVSTVQMVPIRTSFSSPTQKRTQTATRHFNLQSLIHLRRQICLNADAELGKLFREHCLIGFYDIHHALIQSGSNVFLVKNEPILQEFFYQLIIFSIGNIGSYALQSASSCQGGDGPMHPLPICELLTLYQAEEGDDNCSIDDRQIRESTETLLKYKDMLWDFFSINIVDSLPEEKEGASGPFLSSIPCILEGYLPQMASIPALINDLVHKVDYSDEVLCYSAISRALSNFFTPFVMDDEFDEENPKVNEGHRRIHLILRSIVFPTLKSRFLPPCSLWAAVERITDIEQAFKHFGRC